MLSKLSTLATFGLHCHTIEVEVDINSGQSAFIVVGLGDKAIQEAKDRVRSAIKNSGYKFTTKRITCNLAPADLKKIGPSYDVPLALGILISSGQVKMTQEIEESIFLGELSLEGKLKHIHSVISLAMFCREQGVKNIFLPACNAAEASLIEGINVFPVETLRDLVEHVSGQKKIPVFFRNTSVDLTEENFDYLDFKYIKGQQQAKRALEIAASGSHNILFNGAPGSGKTLMARSFQTILPELTLDEALEITRIYSVANKLPQGKPLVGKRPFRSVHHTASDISIVGGGRIPQPGEISLAHRGVLFLDEIAEFPTSVLEVLRQPLEDKVITINRVQGSLSFPAQFIFLAAMNPCPCGYHNVPDSDKECRCASYQIERYQKKISGPLLDRIDLHVDISPVKIDKLTTLKEGEDSETIRSRVQHARNIQNNRFKKSHISCNSEMSLQDIKKFCILPKDAEAILKKAVDVLHLSARSYHRILKISRTIADLNNSESILKSHVAEALQYRKKSND